ncbi:MAG: hypothetical protein ACI3X1_02580 [Eubacteriales bacterium]
MNNSNNENDFSYTYNAKEAAEIKKIRDRYAAPEEDKLSLLRRLDKAVGVKARTLSVIMGIIGTLIMGGGMSLCMVGPREFFVAGIGIGFAGIIIVVLAYPVYSAILKHERKKMAPTILALTDELMK